MLDKLKKLTHESWRPDVWKTADTVNVCIGLSVCWLLGFWLVFSLCVSHNALYYTCVSRTYCTVLYSWNVDGFVLVSDQLLRHQQLISSWYLFCLLCCSFCFQFIATLCMSLKVNKNLMSKKLFIRFFWLQFVFVVCVYAVNEYRV